MSNLSETSTFTANAEVPDPLTPGSAAIGSMLRNGFQAFANRTRWLRNMIMAEGGESGIKRIRTVASVAALRALTDHTHGDFCALVPPSGAPQLFFYSSASGGADDGARTVKPTDVSGSIGRWLDVLRLLADNAGKWLLTGGVTLQGGVTVDDGALNVEQNLNANGNATFAATATFEGNTTTNGTLVCNSGVTMKSSSLLQGALLCSLGGYVRPRHFRVTADENLTVNIATHSVVRVPAGVFSTNRTIFVETTGAGNGAEIEIYTEDPAHLVTVVDIFGNDIIPASLKYASGLPFSVTLSYDNGSWHMKRQSLL